MLTGRRRTRSGFVGAARSVTYTFVRAAKLCRTSAESAVVHRRQPVDARSSSYSGVARNQATTCRVQETGRECPHVVARNQILADSSCLARYYPKTA